jgi:hypothetical protein
MDNCQSNFEQINKTGGNIPYLTSKILRSYHNEGIMVLQERPEINPHIYNQLILNKGAKNIQ